MGLIFQTLLFELCKVIKLPALPVTVQAPVTVVVELPGKVTVFGPPAKVRL